MKRIKIYISILLFISSNVSAGETPQSGFEQAIEFLKKEGVFDSRLKSEKYRAAVAGAKKGDAKSMYDLFSVHLFMAQEYREHSKEASRWLHLSAEAGYAPAMIRLGEYYERGRSDALVEQDHEKALYYYDLAIKADHPYAKLYFDSLVEELECERNLLNGVPC